MNKYKHCHKEGSIRSVVLERTPGEARITWCIFLMWDKSACSVHKAFLISLEIKDGRIFIVVIVIVINIGPSRGDLFSQWGISGFMDIVVIGLSRNIPSGRARLSAIRRRWFSAIKRWWPLLFWLLDGLQIPRKKISADSLVELICRGQFQFSILL